MNRKRGWLPPGHCFRKCPHCFRMSFSVLPSCVSVHDLCGGWGGWGGWPEVCVGVTGTACSGAQIHAVDPRALVQGKELKAEPQT